MIRPCGLRSPNNPTVTCSGHFGENARTLPWEQTDLAVALERLDGDTPGTARLQARWQLSRGGEALDRGIYAASEDAGMSSASLVAAQSRLLQGLGEHLADRLLPRLKAGR